MSNDMAWKEPLKRVESTLTEKLTGIDKRLDRSEADIDDVRKQVRDMVVENRTWMQTLTDKLDRRHEDMQCQNDNIKSLVDKLSVIEARNSKDLESLTKNVSDVTAAVKSITPVVMDLKDCKDKSESDIDELKSWKDREEGAKNTTTEIEAKMWQKKELWIGVVVGVIGIGAGVLFNV